MLLDKDEVPSERQVVRLMRQILDGLVHLHDRCIAHLDIKVRNSFWPASRSYYLHPGNIIFYVGVQFSNLWVKQGKELYSCVLLSVQKFEGF